MQEVVVVLKHILPNMSQLEVHHFLKYCLQKPLKRPLKTQKAKNYADMLSLSQCVHYTSMFVFLGKVLTLSSTVSVLSVPPFSLCCLSPLWHLNSKAALKWRWMAELPQTINKASYVCLKDGHTLCTIIGLFPSVTVHSLILCEQNSVVCCKWHKTVFIRTYALSS